MSINYSGRHDNFEVYCQQCEEENLTTSSIEQPLLSGEKVKCKNCKSEAIVYDDGGIYKIVSEPNKKTNIKIKVA